jgi:type IV secretory pathway VirB4 component
VKRGARAPTLAMGGSYYEPGNPDRPVAFQPLADVDTEAGLAWADTWIEMLLELQGVSVTPHARAELHQSLVALAGSPQHERTVTGYQQLLQHEGLREALAPYTLGGAFGQIFDSDHDTFRLDDWLHVEMEPLMELGEAAVLPALSYLFRRLEARFGGRPTLLVLDECWFALSHPFFASRLKKYLKMLRSKSVYVVFATQEIEDAVDSSIAATILASCQTKIFLPNAGAMDPAGREAYARCGLTDTEIQLLQTATPKRHYFYRSPAGKRLFDMELGPVALAFAGRSSDQDQRLLDELEATCPPGEIATALLRDRGLEWAIDLLAQAYPVLTEQPLAATA